MIINSIFIASFDGCNYMDNRQSHSYADSKTYNTILKFSRRYTTSTCNSMSKHSQFWKFYDNNSQTWVVRDRKIITSTRKKIRLQGWFCLCMRQTVIYRSNWDKVPTIKNWYNNTIRLPKCNVLTHNFNFILKCHVESR